MERPHLMDGVHGYYLPYHAGEEHIGWPLPGLPLQAKRFLSILCWALANFLNKVSVIAQVSDPYVSSGRTHLSYTFRFKQRGFFPYFQAGHICRIPSASSREVSFHTVLGTRQFSQQESGNLDSNIGTRIAGYVFPLMSRASNLRTLISNESKSFLKKHEFSEGTG
ncbi:hypothetical protein GQR58_014198 [Nymphon striatum]|nr:hypothetical protein GQR58_014198 [Nymphon striatum]